LSEPKNLPKEKTAINQVKKLKNQTPSELLKYSLGYNFTLNGLVMSRAYLKNSKVPIFQKWSVRKRELRPAALLNVLGFKLQTKRA
jgi:hypothetical protein